MALTQQQDATIITASQAPTPDDTPLLDEDVQDMAQDNVAGGPNAQDRQSRHLDKRASQYPRLQEAPPVAAPRSPVLRLPDDPKSLQGQRLTRATLPRDRDMLTSKKSK